MQTSSSKLYFAPNDQSLSAKSLPGDTFCLFELKFVIHRSQTEWGASHQTHTKHCWSKILLLHCLSLFEESLEFVESEVTCCSEDITSGFRSALQEETPGFETNCLRDQTVKFSLKKRLYIGGSFFFFLCHNPLPNDSFDYHKLSHSVQ